METISPEEDALFRKALRFLWEQRLAMEGIQADVTPYPKEKAEE